MKKPLLVTLTLSLLLSISACQQTPQSVTTVEKKVVNVPEFIKEPIGQPVIIAKKPHQHDDVWQRIRSQLSIKVPRNKAVEKWRQYYLSHPNFMVTISKRAEPFLYYIVTELEKRNMPVELALLPIVESAYIPYGVSHKKAVGLWQFMPISGERFDLHQNWWVDDRRDIVQSTRAALDYFQFFHKTLGQDWLNAIAAFNSGEGRVGRAIKKNKREHKPIDFWSLRLPSETSDFVPKLLAIADILQHAKALNYTFTPIANKPAVALIELDSQLDLTLAAEWANMTPKQLLRLNPAYNRWATAPNRQYQLMIPAVVESKFRQKLASINKKDWFRWHRHVVKSGDSLSVIARRVGTTVEGIKKLNRLSSSRIRIGQTLVVPYVSAQLHPWQSAKVRKERLVYIVKNGDNLWNISRKYKVKVQDIVRWNRLSTNNPLQPKQRLKIIL